MKLKQKIEAVVLLLVMFCFSDQVIGQQLPFFNQNQNNFNPASINGDYHKYYLPTQAGIRYRYQWMQIEGAPRTLNAFYSHWDEDYNVSYGGNLISDQTGPTSFTGIYGKVAYGLELNSDWMVTAGLTGGVVQYRVNSEKLDLLEAEIFEDGTLTKIFPDFGAGATVYFKEKYYFGISIPQVLGLNLNFRDDQNNINTARVRHYNANVGAYFKLYKGSFLDPILEVRYVENAPLLISGRLQYTYREIFWIGVSGSSSREAGINAGVIWNTNDNNILKLGYSLANHFQTFGPRFGSIHEIGLSLSW